MAFRHLLQLFGFFEEASKYASPDEDAVAQAGPDALRHVSFYRRIVAVSILFGTVGAVLGVGMIILAAGEKTPGTDTAKMLIAPPVFAAAGLVFGVSVACLFAPSSFLTGPIGQKLMQLIGTQDIRVARAACLLWTLFLMALIALISCSVWSDMQRGLF
jgi:uncharacterized membrane protein YfcA